MFWLSFAGNGSNYVLAIALPMILIGAGQGAVLSPLTTAGIAQINARDAGAASGVVNVAHQVGGSLGLALLVVLSSVVANSNSLVIRTDWALRGGVAFLVIALILTFIMIVPKKNKN